MRGLVHCLAPRPPPRPRPNSFLNIASRPPLTWESLSSVSLSDPVFNSDGTKAPGASWSVGKSTGQGLGRSRARSLLSYHLLCDRWQVAKPLWVPVFLAKQGRVHQRQGFLPALGKLVCFPRHNSLTRQGSDKELCSPWTLSQSSVHLWATGYFTGHPIVIWRWKQGEQPEIETCWHYEGPTVCQAPAGLSRSHPIPWEGGFCAGLSCSEPGEKRYPGDSNKEGALTVSQVPGARLYLFQAGTLASAKALRQELPGVCEDRELVWLEQSEQAARVEYGAGGPESGQALYTATD